MKILKQIKGMNLSQKYREYAIERMHAVRAEMERQDISLMELAIRCQVSYWTVWRVWRGKMVPTQETLSRMERALGIRQKKFKKNRFSS